MVRQLTDPRELRGLAILSQPNTVIQTGENEWDVRSQSKDAYYAVARTFPSDRKARILSQATWTCSCPDFQTRNLPCKHIHAVMLSLKLAGDVEEHSTPAQVEKVEPKILCPVCKSANVRKWGNRKTRYGTVQRYACHECGHTFVIDKGFSKMKNSPKTITLTLDLYFKGVSLRKIADHLTQVESVSVNQATILRWIRKYLKLLSGYAEKYKADVGNIWHCDETTVFIKKEGEKKYYEWIGTSWMQRPVTSLLAKSQRHVTSRMHENLSRRPRKLRSSTGRDCDRWTHGIQGRDKGRILRTWQNPEPPYPPKRL